MNKLLLILIVIFTFSSEVLASNIIRLQTTTTAAGDTGSFLIVMKNDITVNGIQFILKYEPDLITPIKIMPIDKAGILTGSGAELFGEDKIAFLVYDNGSAFFNSDSGNIFRVDYLVSDSAKGGSVAHLTFTEASAADSNIQPVEFEFINGMIPIGELVYVANENTIIPARYELFQNYPNPLNPSTKIKYSIPVLSQVMIKVYDVLGAEVEKLVDEEKPAGVYVLTWNAAKMPSGVYFYQIKAGSFSETKKMILMK